MRFQSVQRSLKKTNNTHTKQLKKTTTHCVSHNISAANGKCMTQIRRYLKFIYLKLVDSLRQAPEDEKSDGSDLAAVGSRCNGYAHTLRIRLREGLHLKVQLMCPGETEWPRKRPLTTFNGDTDAGKQRLHCGISAAQSQCERRRLDRQPLLASGVLLLALSQF